MTELQRAQGGDASAFAALVKPHQRELRAFCYRMAGSLDDADDLLQESLLRAWRGLPGFAGDASLRTWLYRVTSSACIDRLKHRKARKRAEDETAAGIDGAAFADDEGIGPCPASLYEDEGRSPEARITRRESVAFAFLAALQLLPAQQRAVLIACDVLGFSADECAGLVGSSAVGVGSTLRRARDAIAKRAPAFAARAKDDDKSRALVARYVDAWDRADARALVALLHEDAAMTMPPMRLWLRGPTDIARSLDDMVFAGCGRGDFRCVVSEANGLPALGVYRRSDAGFVPFALHVLAIDRGADAVVDGVGVDAAVVDVDGALRHLTCFLDPRLFVPFGLPPSLGAT